MFCHRMSESPSPLKSPVPIAFQLGPGLTQRRRRRSGCCRRRSVPLCSDGDLIKFAYSSDLVTMGQVTEFILANSPIPSIVRASRCNSLIGGDGARAARAYQCR